MSDDPISASANIRRSNDVAERFDAYFLALTFTLVAAAVQTAKWSDTYPFSNYAEIVGWLFLAFSGLVGLYRAENLPAFFIKSALLAKLEADVRRRQQNPNAKEGIHEFAAPLHAEEVALSKMNEGMMRAYRWQKVLFVLGLMTSIGRRGFEGLVH